MSPEQETQLAETLGSDKSAYDWMKSNFISPSQNALNDLGLNVDENLLPYNYGTALDKSNLVESYNVYDNITPQRIENGFNTMYNIMTGVNLAVDVAQVVAVVQGTVTSLEPIITSTTSIILP